MAHTTYCMIHSKKLNIVIVNYCLFENKYLNVYPTQLVCIIATILTRNPELEFPHAVRLDGIILDAANILKQDKSVQAVALPHKEGEKHDVTNTLPICWTLSTFCVIDTT